MLLAILLSSGVPVPKMCQNAEMEASKKGLGLRFKFDSVLAKWCKVCSNLTIKTVDTEDRFCSVILGAYLPQAC